MKGISMSLYIIIISYPHLEDDWVTSDPDLKRLKTYFTLRYKFQFFSVLLYFVVFCCIYFIVFFVVCILLYIYIYLEFIYGILYFM